MKDLRIVKRELVVRLTTEKGSVLYEPAEPALYIFRMGGLSEAFYRCDKEDADGAVFSLTEDADETTVK